MTNTHRSPLSTDPLRFAAPLASKPVLALALGDWDASEFRPVQDWLARHCQLHTAHALADGLAFLKRPSRLPRIVVLAQNRPGQCAPSFLQALQAADPLAPLLGLLGPWCEGETRNGHPWPGLWRVPWHDFIPRLTPELPRLRLGLPLSWGAWRFGNEEEFSPHALADPLPAPPKLQLDPVLVVAHPAVADGILAACKSLGRPAIALRDPHALAGGSFSAGVVDCPRSLPDASPALQVVRRLCSQQPVLALVGFPRPEDAPLARSLNLRLIAKPFHLDHFLAQLSSLPIGD